MNICLVFLHFIIINNKYRSTNNVIMALLSHLILLSFREIIHLILRKWRLSKFNLPSHIGLIQDAIIRTA